MHQFTRVRENTEQIEMQCSCGWSQAFALDTSGIVIIQALTEHYNSMQADPAE